jgi:acyl-CoA synthetase (NDP forming)
LNQEKLREFEPVFYPKSIAVVGVSLKKYNNGTAYLRALLDNDFKGKVYPVNPSGGNLFGLKVYPDIISIPYPVDYVYVAIPRQHVLDLLDDCAAKGVKVVHFFTAGFSETGEEQGTKLEDEIVKKARENGFRIIGPNSVGVYSPAINMPCAAAGLLGEAGSTALVAQSGSLTLRILQSAIVYGLRLSKAVSFGNGADLDSTDFLEYLAVDPETKVISAYIEGLKNGRRFLQVVEDISKRKPIIIWKGGKTEAGNITAASHTGALASPSFLWTAALKQTGAIEVNTIEELVDTLLAFQQFPLLESHGIAIVSGLIDGGGGQSVSAADTCITLGLEVPSFSDEARIQLEALLGRVGSILHNPLDVSQARGNIEVICRAIEIALADPHIDLVIIQENMDLLLRLLPWEAIERLGDMLIELCGTYRKSIAVILQPGLSESERLTFTRKLSAAQIAVFPTLERTARAIANMRRYSDYRKIISANR